MLVIEILKEGEFLMLLLLRKKDIILGLAHAVSIIPQRTGAPYLRAIWLQANEDSLDFIATDAQIEFRGTCEAEVEEKGLIGVNGRLFFDLLKKMPDGDIKLFYKDNDDENGIKYLQVSQGRRSFKIPTSESVWFQQLAPLPEDKIIRWGGDFFAELINRISFCINDEEMSDALNCFYLHRTEGQMDAQPGQIAACGLNGHQFALQKIINDDVFGMLDSPLLIARKNLQTLARWMNDDEIDIAITDKRIFCRNAEKSETISFPKQNYTYPDYVSFMVNTSEASHLTLDRKSLMEALNRLIVFCTDMDKSVFFDLTETCFTPELKLSAQSNNTGIAEETVDCMIYDGNIKKIAFPAKDLLEICDHFQSEKITMNLTGEEKGCLITGDQDIDYSVLIMPMRVQTEYQDYQDTDNADTDADAETN